MDRKLKYVLLITSVLILICICAFAIYPVPLPAVTPNYQTSTEVQSKAPEPDSKNAVLVQAPLEKNEDSVVDSVVSPVIHYPVSPKTTQGEKKKVYITIDDGPSTEITEKMLDVLKQYNAKATFFVIGSQIHGKENILKRIHAEGHGIGLHSYTHNIKKIYSSHDIFINEMIQTADEINRVVGIRPVVLRFPGGSGGRLSKEFLDKLHKANYRIFDWNISAGDGMYPNNPPDRIFENATNPQQLTSNAILLMHDKPNNQKSCEALPMIIEYYRNHGYEFKTITEETPEYYFKFKM